MDPNPFADLMPQPNAGTNPFADLIPQAQADEGTFEPATILPVAINKQTGKRKLAVPGALQHVGDVIQRAMSGDERAALEAAAIFSPTPAGKLSWAAKPVARGVVGPAANRLGVDLPRAATGGRIQQNVSRRLSDVPVVGTPIEKASSSAIGQIGQAAKKVEQGYGAGSVPAAGEAARAGIGNYIKNVSREGVSKAYDKVDGLVDQGVTSRLSATERTAAEIARRRQAAAQGGSSALSVVDEALARPEGLTYAGIKQLRTSVGEMLDGGTLPAGISNSELKQIYGSLTQDLKAAVYTAGGPKALQQFERANRYNALVSANREKLVTILGAKSDEAIVDRVLGAAGSTARADSKLLARARKALDKDTWNEIASASVAKLGRDAEGNFTPDRFLTAWGKISPQGKATLFGGQPDLLKSLNDIATVSSRFKQLNRYANPSGTGGMVSMTGMLGWVATEPLSAITTLVGGRVAAHILSKPSTARSVAKWAKQAEAAATAPQSKSNLANYRVATRALALSIAAELGVEDQAKRIEEELNQATIPGMMGT